MDDDTRRGGVARAGWAAGVAGWAAGVAGRRWVVKAIRPGFGRRTRSLPGADPGIRWARTSARIRHRRPVPAGVGRTGPDLIQQDRVSGQTSWSGAVVLVVAGVGFEPT